MKIPIIADESLPEVQVLMAAVIRLMARCLARPDETETGTLLQLLSRLREHPDLCRDAAVRAALAESHFTWVARRGAGETVVEAPPCTRGERKLH